MWLLHFINNTAVFLFAKCERCQQESMGEISSSSGIIICFFCINYILLNALWSLTKCVRLPLDI